MKKVLTVVAIALMGAVVAQGALWSDDFSTANIYVDIPQGGATWADGDIYVPGDMGTDTWGVHAAKANISSGTLNVSMLKNKNEMTSAGVVIDSSNFAGAGTYSLQYDITTFNNNLMGGAYVWEVDTSGTNGAYYLDLTAPVGTEPSLKNWPANTSTFSKLAGQTTSAVGSYTLDFAYTGDGKDVVVFLATENVGTSVTWNRAIKYDNVEIVPEPATFGLMGIAGLGLMIARRRARG